MLNRKAKSNDDVDYSDKSVIIVGNEQSGINKLTAKNSDQSIMINTNRYTINQLARELAHQQKEEQK